MRYLVPDRHAAALAAAYFLGLLIALVFVACTPDDPCCTPAGSTPTATAPTPP